MGKLIDLTGKTFNFLKVIERDYEYEKTVKNKQPYWKCQCLNCGRIKTIQGAAIRNGHSKSCGCLQKQITSENTLNDLTHKQFGDLYVLERDKSKPKGHQSKAYWICQCKCGKILSVVGVDLKSGHTQSCGCSIKSKGERKIEELLLSMNINFKIQYKFSDLIGDNSQLRFDFAIFDQNNSLICLIEYQGQQHYKQVELFQTEEQFLKQKENDNKKQRYCQEKKIKLIEIPYWDYQKINENYLKEKIYGI